MSNVPLFMSIEEATNEDILTHRILNRVYIVCKTIRLRSQRENIMFPSRRP